jgi:predicted O-methyltransferase YrrM
MGITSPERRNDERWPTAESIIATGEVTDASGRPIQLHSHTSLEQCRFLKDLIGRTNASRCLEIGLAYGISSLAICEAISQSPGASLISIDPFQDGAWSGIGRLNLQRAGFGDIVEFHQRPSFEVLPALLGDGRAIHFAYVDSVKVFDMLLVDAFYITRLLEVGGTLVFDDCDWPGVRALVRYLASMPHLRIVAKFDRMKPSQRRRIASRIISAIPGREKIFRSDLVGTAESLGIDASCIAFEKVSDDTRQWDWFSRL